MVTIDFGHVDDDVDIIAADFIGGHIHRGGIGCDVNFRENIEEVCFLKTTVAAEIVEEGFKSREVRNQLLNDFAESFEDGMIIDRSEMETDGSVFDIVIRELVLDSLHDVPLNIKHVIIGETINFVDEDLDINVWEFVMKIDDCAAEAANCFEIIILSIDNPDQCTKFTKYSIEIELRFSEIDLARKIPYLEIHEGA